MKPLSPWLYLRRNPGMVVGTGLFAAAMVFLCVTALSIIQGFGSSARRSFEQLRYFSLVVPESGAEPARSRLRRIGAHASVARVHEARVFPVRMETLFGQLELKLIAVETRAHPWLVARVGNRLRAGRWPRPEAAELALHEQVVRAHGLTLGQTFRQLGFRLVGVLSGPTVMGVVPLEHVKSARFPQGQLMEEHYLVAPRSAQRRAMNRHLRRLAGFTTLSYERADGALRRNTRTLVQVLHFIAVLLFLLAALIVGIVHKVYFEERQDELALLTALGLTSSRILRRSLAETLVISGGAWLVGVLLGLGGLAALQRWVFLPRGLEFPVIASGPLWFSALLPVAAVLVTLLTSWRVFRRIDPVALIDRRR